MNSATFAAGKSDVLVCFAVKEEAAPFLKTALSRRVSVLITGMGETNASRAVLKAFETSRPATVLSCGFAGALDPGLAVGTVLISSDGDFPFRSQLISSGAQPATFVCAKRVAIFAREKAALRERTGRDAVEMESKTIRRLCRERGISSATVRVISDAANEDLPLDFNRLMTDAYQINFAKLIGNVVLRPWKIPALIGLQKKTRMAAEILSRSLETLPI